MVLNFGAGSLFPDREVVAVGYKSPESGQNETLKTYRGATIGYSTIYTVAQGKTFNITHIIVVGDNVSDTTYRLATGEAASEVDIMFIPFDPQTNPITQIQLTVPIKFVSGTRISVYNSSSIYPVAVNLVGFEE